MYLALSSRIAKTEVTLISLTAQVAELTSIVKTATLSIPSAKSGLTSSAVIGGGSASLFSPFDEKISPAHTAGLAEGGRSDGNAVVGSGGGGVSAGAQDSSIAALTQQISALSTSVAQLQRLQQSQSSLARTPSSTSIPSAPLNPIGSSQTMPSIASHAHPGNVSIGSRFMPTSASDLISGGGALTTPSNMMSMPIGIPLSPIPPSQKRDMMFPGPPLSGTGRPNINRSISSSVIGNSQDGESKWGNPGRLGGPGQLQMPSMGGAVERVWSPGGMMTPTVSMNGGMSNAMGASQGGAGAAAPGAGIVVTKWEHLNLKVDLLRAVNKYG